jgi:hypothetical protein
MEGVINDVLINYSENIKKELLKSVDILENKINIQMKNKFIVEIKGSDNYDYRKIKEINKEELIKQTISIANCGNHALYIMDKQVKYINTFYTNYDPAFSKYINGHTDWSNFITNFVNGTYFEENEKICLNINYTNSYKSHYLSEHETLNINYFLTNYGRILICIAKNGYNNNPADLIQKLYNFDIWLPLDYIELIKIMKPTETILIETIKKIKDELYLRSHTNNDDTIQKVILENKQLSDKLQNKNKEFDELNEKYTILLSTYNTINNKYEKIKQILQ